MHSHVLKTFSISLSLSPSVSPNLPPKSVEIFIFSTIFNAPPPIHIYMMLFSFSFSLIKPYSEKNKPAPPPSFTPSSMMNCI